MAAGLGIRAGVLPAGQCREQGGHRAPCTLLHRVRRGCGRHEKAAAGRERGAVARHVHVPGVHAERHGGGLP